jgi:hypothetical protein
MSKIQLTIKKHEGAWAVFRTFDDWGPIILAHNRTAPDAQDYAWQCATEYAEHEHDVTVTIDARG